MPKKERLEVDLEIGKREYFLRQSSSGLVLGPKSEDAYDRHVTFAFDVKTEELKHVHMKSGRAGVLREDWRIIPRRIMPDVSDWIRKNSHPAGPASLSDLDRSSYAFSVRRIMITFSIIEPAFTRMVWTICRVFGVIRLSSTKKAGVTHIQGVIEFDQLRKQLQRFRRFRRFLAAVASVVLARALNQMAKLHLLELNDMAEGHVCLVFPKQAQEPVVVVRDKQYLLIPLERVYCHATSWFSNLKVSEMMPDLSTSTEHPVPIRIRTKGIPP